MVQFRPDPSRPDGRSLRCRECLRVTVGRRKARATQRRSRIKVTYGVTGDEYEALLAAQGGVCAICKGRRSYNLAVDHCHATGEVRGLLCRQCNNRLLPTVRDDVGLLRRAIDYLTEPPARAVFGSVRVIPDHADDEAKRKRLWKDERRVRPQAIDPAEGEELSLFDG